MILHAELRTACEYFLVAGLLLLPFSTPAGRDSVVISFGLPVLLCAGALMTAHATRMVTADRVPSNVWLLAAAMVVWMLMTAFAGPNPTQALARVFTQAVGVSIFLYVLTLSAMPVATRLQSFRRVCHALLASGLVLSAYFLATLLQAILQYGLRGAYLQRQVGGAMALPWGASNVIAATLLMPLVVAVVWAQSGERRWSVRWGPAALISTAILGTLSRNAIIVVAFMTVMMLFLNRDWKPLVAVGASVSAIVGAVVLYSPEAVQQVIAGRLTESTFQQRMELWENSVRYLAANPTGPIGYYASIAVFGASSHNVFLTTAVEQGYPGLVLFIAFSVALLAVALRAYRGRHTSTARQTAKIFLVGLVGVGLNLQFEDPNFTQPYIIYFWVFTGLLFTLPAALNAEPPRFRPPTVCRRRRDD